MPAPTPPPKSALVTCYSPVRNDARVSIQIRWLEAAGVRVDVLSRGPDHPAATGRRFTIGEPSRRAELIFYALLPSPLRFRGVVGKHLPTAQLAGLRWDLVVVNDHHLLPWAAQAAPSLTDGPVVLDLHELYAGRGSGLYHHLVYGRYDDWLLSFCSSPAFTHHLTVAEGIADIYRDDYGLPRPTVIRNVAPFEDLEPSPVRDDAITLVHHGVASVQRGIDLMLDAALELDPRFRLVLMVIGAEHELAPLRAHPAVETGRAMLRDPVPVTEVARTLNQYDLEVVFLPPRFRNNRHALPNKFFEAVQGRLGVVIGESPELVGFVREKGFGVIVEGWTAGDLAATINALTTDDITTMKHAAHAAAQELSAVGEGHRFLAAVGALAPDDYATDLPMTR